MKKRVLVFLALLVLVIGTVTGCNSDDKSGEDNINDSIYYDDEKRIEMTFVGSNSKPAGAMGTMSGGHLLNFYKNGTVEIFSGFFATVAGSKSEFYYGTYKLDGDKLSVEYKAEDETLSFETTINDDMFRAQIYLIAAFPDDGTNSEVAGYDYYRIDNMTVKQAQSAYLGVYKNENTYRAYCLRLNNDNTFDLSLNENGVIGTTNGQFNIEFKGLEEADQFIAEYKLMSIENGEITSDTKSNQYYKEQFDFNNDKLFKFRYIFDKSVSNQSNDENIESADMIKFYPTN